MVTQRLISTNLACIRRFGSASRKSDSVCSRTWTTSAIWAQRLEVEKQRRTQMRKDIMIRPKTVEESAFNLALSFGSDADLKAQYLRFDGGVRFELILEDLDAAAGNIAFSHCDGGFPDSPPVSLVTAACDGIEMMRRFPMDRDLEIVGRVTWVGSSSMEIWLQIIEAEKPQAQILQAYFVMVARDENTKQSIKVNPLQVSDQGEEQWRFIQGEANKKNRIQESKSSLSVMEPTPSEVVMIHKLMADHKRSGMFDKRGAMFRRSSNSNTSGNSSILMKEAVLESVTVTQPQNQNTKGKIFGGYLMRTAFELSRSVAYAFCGPDSRPFFIAVDDILFLRPVEIGSMIRFKARVVYAPGGTSRAFQVKVSSEITNLRTGETDTTNLFHFTYATQSCSVPQVVPESYQEAMDYLDGKRRFENCKELALRSRSELFMFY